MGWRRDGFSVSYFVYTDDDTSKSVPSLTSMIRSDISSSISSNLVTDEWSGALADSSTQGVKPRLREAGVLPSLPKTFFSYEAQTEPLSQVDVTTNSTASSSSSSSNDDANSNSDATSSSSPVHRVLDFYRRQRFKLLRAILQGEQEETRCFLICLEHARRRHHARNPALHSHRSSSSSKRASNSSKGYQDGLAASKKFAKLSGSKLGFTLQFIKDTVGDKFKATDSYIKDFTNCMKDGEGQVDKAYEAEEIEGFWRAVPGFSFLFGVLESFEK